MKQKSYFPWLLVLILLLLLTGSFWWSRQEIRTLKQQYHSTVWKAENQYQRSFGELSDSVSAMNGQLAQLLVTTSQEHLMLGLSSLWREVYNAAGHLGSLPVAMHELENTDRLLSDVAEYSQYLLRKNVLQQKPLSDTDWRQLEDFYQRSRVVQTELNKLENRVLNENLLFSSLSIGDKENAVSTAFQSIESQVHAFPALELEEGVRKIEPDPRPVAGTRISREEAIASANEFLNLFHISHTGGQVEFVSEDTAIPVYGVRYRNQNKDTVFYVEVSQNGGHILQFYQTREIGQPFYTAEQAAAKAETLLQSLHFTDMACIDIEKDTHIADLTFVPKQNGIYIYSDMVKIQMALDDNSILNFDQTSYATRHYARTIPAPAVSKEQILRNMNPHFQIDEVRLALIPDEYSSEELLTYEVRGSIVNEAFSIFVNASTGQEVRIVRRTSPETA